MKHKINKSKIRVVFFVVAEGKIKKTSQVPLFRALTLSRSHALTLSPRPRPLPLPRPPPPPPPPHAVSGLGATVLLLGGTTPNPTGGGPPTGWTGGVNDSILC